MDARPYSYVIETLRGASLRPTRQRIALAKLLFDDGHRHVTAESLHADAQEAALARIKKEGADAKKNQQKALNAKRNAPGAKAGQKAEQTVSSPGWREHALDSAPPIARHDPRGARGVFFGYDFHLDDDKLGLIEINTNAGGAMLNVLLARAQRSCSNGVVGLSPGQEGPGGFERSILDMFAQEWSTSGEPRPLTRVVILDESPQAQYLYPEFLLFQRLFESAGIDCLIADPADLAFHNECLLVDGKPVDLVYNRLTDFYLEGDNCSALRSAYLADVVTVTPRRVRIVVV